MPADQQSDMPRQALDLPGNATVVARARAFPVELCDALAQELGPRRDSEPVLRQLAQSAALKPHAYAASTMEDRVTRRMWSAFSSWRGVANLSDPELAAAIMADGIDILIDLSGHTGGNRLPVLARKPAPLQASWIGYPCSTGLDAVDYCIGDDHFLPAGRFDHWFSERIVRFPALVAFQPSPAAAPPNSLPGLTAKRLSFASFNQACPR